MKYFKISLLILLLLILQKVYGLKPDTTYHWKPEIYGLMYKEYKVKTDDNYLINVWFYPAQESLSNDSMRYYFDKKSELRTYDISNEKKPTIIVCNGDAGNMAQLLSFAYIFSTNGFNVITFDWRGFGESQSFPIDTNMLVYTEFLSDYNAVVDDAVNLETVNKDKIGVFGFSTGGFLSFAIANQRTEIKAIIARGIFTDYEKVTPLINKRDLNDIHYYPKDIDKYSPKENWNKFTKPIFLIVGENDKRTPKENSIEIISRVQSEIRELWIVKEASHGGKLAPEIIENELFIKKSIRFYNENL